MLHSGEILNFSDINAPKADKHSTGGVGDKTSLIIAPLAAACGLAVPMISGRGLGHTGGTLDKLESVSGYNVNLSLSEFKKIVKSCGFAMSGQTAEIAPADRKLYALRDATATIDSIPLIVASIMSKKLAEGLDVLILDVKTGSGAFMQNFDDAKKLAEAMCETGKACGVKTSAVISDMNEPLGKFVGNALEVYECIQILLCQHDEKMNATINLSLELTSQMLVSARIVAELENARALCEERWRNGDAYTKFSDNVFEQGGDCQILDNPEILIDKDLIQVQIKSELTGFVRNIDAKAIGEAVSIIGGGRVKASDSIDHAVGFQMEAKIGDELREGETLGIMFCRHENQVHSVLQKLLTAFEIGDEKPEKLELIKAIVE
jgi:pyrimidine-nucleoside phosphorylase